MAEGRVDAVLTRAMPVISALSDSANQLHYGERLLVRHDISIVALARRANGDERDSEDVFVSKSRRDGTRVS